MVASQLLVALVVLLDSDGAQAQGNRQCVYKEGEFCHHVKKAFNLNEEAIHYLKQLSGHSGDWMELLEINSLLRFIMTKTDKAELLVLTVLYKKEIAEGTEPKVVEIVESAQSEYEQGRNRSVIDSGIKLGESIATNIYKNRLIKFRPKP